MDSFHVVYGARGDFGFLFLRVPKRNLLRGGRARGRFRRVEALSSLSAAETRGDV